METNTLSLREQILKNHSPSVRRRAELEYDVVCAVIRECRKSGYLLHSVAWDEYTPTPTREAALRLVFDLDECTLRFKRTDSERLYGVFLVMGNSGWDVVSDYTSDGGDDIMNPTPGSFAAAVEAATEPFARKYG